MGMYRREHLPAKTEEGTCCTPTVIVVSIVLGLLAVGGIFLICVLSGSGEDADRSVLDTVSKTSAGGLDPPPRTPTTVTTDENGQTVTRSNHDTYVTTCPETGQRITLHGDAATRKMKAA